MDIIQKKHRYEEVQDVINLAQIKMSRMRNVHKCNENKEINECLKSATMWIDHAMLTMEADKEGEEKNGRVEEDKGVVEQGV